MNYSPIPILLRFIFLAIDSLTQKSDRIVSELSSSLAGTKLFSFLILRYDHPKICEKSNKIVPF